MKDIINRCKVCSKPLSGRQTMFCSSNCKNKVHQSYGAQKERSLERKLYFIQMLGGMCSHCGYKANLAALSFHHRSGKEYKLDARSMSNRGLNTVKKEIEKCELLCSNCHIEIHHPSLDLAKMSIEPTALTTELQAPKYATSSKEIIPKKSDIVKKFNENIQNCRITNSDNIVVGVSGGIDSVVLLNLLTKLPKKLRPKIIVAHFDHAYRAKSDADEKFVGKLSAGFGLKFVSKKLKSADRHSNIRGEFGISSNLEEYFRDERRQFLLEVAEKNEANFVCLGHNADDQAETIIMNLTRGSGPAGLGGMHMTDGKIIRPLLNIARTDIESYATNNSISWHEDITNQDLKFNRNYIRHQILPLLHTINPEFLENINRSAWVQRRLDGYIKDRASEILKQIQDDVRVGLALQKPVLYEIFAQMYEKVKGDRKNLSQKNLQDLDNLIQKTSGTSEVSLPTGIIARRSYAKLDFLPKMKDNKVPPRQVLKIGKTVFGEWKITLENSDLKKSIDKHICFVSNSDNLVIRTPKPGDRIVLLGSGGTKKLQDIFTDAKIDRDKRRFWPVIEQSGKIIWLPGLAFSKIDLDNKNVIKITVQGIMYEENSKAKEK